MGLISDDAAFTTHPKAVKKIRFEDPIHEADMDVKELKNKSDFVLVLSHMGVEQGLQLGKKVKDVDVIIGGHDHRALASFKSGKDKACILIDHKTPFCVTEPNGKVLGRLDMSVDGKKVKYQNSKLIPITSDIEDDPTVAATVKTYADKMHKKYGRVIGEAKENLESSREAQNKLGHLVAESIRVKTGADVGLMNSGGLRTSIKKGPITIGNIVEVSPFQNSLVLLEVTGKEIFDIMNFSFSNQKRGGYPQVS